MENNDEKKVEDWNKFLKNQYKMPERLKLIDLEKHKEKPYIKFVLIFFGMLAIAGALAYNGYQGNYKSNIDINETLVCEADTLNCDCKPCPENNCNVDLVCPNVTFPNELDLNLYLKNTTG